MNFRRTSEWSTPWGSRIGENQDVACLFLTRELNLDLVNRGDAGTDHSEHSTAPTLTIAL